MISETEKLLAEMGPAFEKEILRVIPRKGVKNLHDAVWYHLDAGGKRIRPALAVVTCKSFGGDPKKVMPFAAACELFHSWCLVHDDIQDGDLVRRNRPALWAKYGMPHGINVGDFISDKVYDLALQSEKAGLDAETTLSLVKEIAITSSKTAEGQAMDMNLRKEDSPSENSYFETIRKKTAWYFTLPIVGGALVAGQSQATIQKIRAFGMKAGPAFQIADDVLDLTEEKGREEIGSDIKEGKRSIMVVHCSTACTPKEKDQLFEILNKPREETTKEDIVQVKSLFEKYGSVDYAQKRAKELIQEAKEISAAMPQEAREILNSFADYIIERKH